jgi:hypothetical protein
MVLDIEDPLDVVLGDGGFDICRFVHYKESD